MVYFPERTASSQVTEFSGALRNILPVIISNFVLVYSGNWLYSGKTLRFMESKLCVLTLHLKCSRVITTPWRWIAVSGRINSPTRQHLMQNWFMGTIYPQGRKEAEALKPGTFWGQTSFTGGGKACKRLLEVAKVRIIMILTLVSKFFLELLKITINVLFRSHYFMSEMFRI